ncbi:permease-like cell division protein FtsX [Alkalibacter mobilis]|uniref:permease-like cell division protein FtsX n=1 Tax=Alkalibacter mobilis TaxID=2787712 RepID=UPI002FC2ACD5
MKLHTFKYFFRDTARSIKRNSLMSIASVISVIAALVILGIFLVIALNIQQMTADMESQLELKVFLLEDISEEQKSDLETVLKADDRISEVRFESKEDALNKMSTNLEEYKGILQGLEQDNPLPESFILRVNDSERIKEVNDSVLELEGVDYVNYGEGYVDALMKFNDFTNMLSLAVLVILTGISVFIIYNTIKLTVHSRRKEISIMKYVGATNWYIRIPFIIEGAILGLSGSILAILVVRNLYYYLLGAVAGQSTLFMGISFAEPGQILPSIALYFILYGIVVGSAGSLFSITKFLDV